MKFKELWESKKFINYGVVKDGVIVLKGAYHKRRGIYTGAYKEFTSKAALRKAMLEYAAQPVREPGVFSFGYSPLMMPPQSIFGGLFDNKPKDDELDADILDVEDER